MSRHDTFTVGTRTALAWIRPASSGSRRSMPTSQAGGHRNHRLERRAGTAQVFMVVGVNHRLVVHRRVNRGNRHVLQAESPRPAGATAARRSWWCTRRWTPGDSSPVRQSWLTPYTMVASTSASLAIGCENSTRAAPRRRGTAGRRPGSGRPRSIPAPGPRPAPPSRCPRAWHCATPSRSRH
jgi:hypothetical protein